MELSGNTFCSQAPWFEPASTASGLQASRLSEPLFPHLQNRNSVSLSTDLKMQIITAPTSQDPWWRLNEQCLKHSDEFPVLQKCYQSPQWCSMRSVHKVKLWGGVGVWNNYGMNNHRYHPHLYIQNIYHGCWMITIHKFLPLCLLYYRKDYGLCC